MRIKAEEEGGTHTIDVVGALHGELQALVPLDALAPLDDLVGKLSGRGIPGPVLALGKFGTAHQLYIPWMQASYIMVANKKALPFLPSGADINALSYDQFAAWASTVEQKTARRLLGFPAGPQGLMHRFFEGFFYPSYTGGVVVPFRSEAAEAMWTQFASLWRSVNPASTSYNFMQQLLLSGDRPSPTTACGCLGRRNGLMTASNRHCHFFDRRPRTSKNAIRKQGDAMTRTFAAAIFAVLAAIQPVHAATEALDLQSANFLLPGCEYLVAAGGRAEDFAHGDAAALMAQSTSCVAAITTAALIMSQDKVICVPNGVTALLEEKLVVKWMNDNPDKLQQSYASFIYVALKKTWPCN